MTIVDDLDAGRAGGRIRRTELRLRLTDHEASKERLHLAINGRRLAFEPDRTLTNGAGDEWLVFDDPGLRAGSNAVLLILEGASTPKPWPVLHSVEAMVGVLMSAMDVGTKRQLFIDGRFIDSSEGVALTMNPPVQHPEPVVVSDRPWEELGDRRLQHRVARAGRSLPHVVRRLDEGRPALGGRPAPRLCRVGRRHPLDEAGAGPDHVPRIETEQHRRAARRAAEHAGRHRVPRRPGAGRRALQALDQVPPHRRRGRGRRAAGAVGHALAGRHPLADLSRSAQPARRHVRRAEHAVLGRPAAALRRLHPRPGHPDRRRGGRGGRPGQLPVRRPDHLSETSGSGRRWRSSSRRTRRTWASRCRGSATIRARISTSTPTAR